MQLLLVILLYALSPVLILIFIPVYLAFFIWRTLVRMSLWLKFGSRAACLMRSVDSAPIHSPLRCSEALSCVLIEVDGDVDVGELKERIRTKLVDVKDSSGHWKHRRLRQGVQRYGGYFIWQDVPDFNLDNHVDHLKNRTSGSVVSFKDDADKAQVVNDVINDSEDVFQFGQPCWKFLVVPRMDRHQTLIILMASHCMWDAGAIGMVLVPALCDGVVENPFMHMKCVPGWARLWLYVRGLIGLPLFIASQAFGARDNNPLQDKARMAVNQSPKSRKYPGKLSYWSGSIPVSKVKEIKAMTGHKFNDVILTAVARGLRRYLAKHGDERKAENWTVTNGEPIALWMPGDPIELTNRIVVVNFPLPLTAGANAIDHLAKMEQTTRDYIKSDYLWSAMLFYNQLFFNVLPVGLVEPILKKLADKPTMAVTIFRGAGQILKMFNNTIANFHGVLSIPRTTQLGVLVQSNGGELAINVTGLKTSFPEIDELKDLHAIISQEIDILAQEITEIKSAATAEAINGTTLSDLGSDSLV